MIRIHRTPTPPTLSKRGAKWLRDCLSASTRESQRTAHNRYRHPQIKKALDALFHGKCAYCESKITHVDYGHIEHYRPKSGLVGRPDLTFEWSNMLLACAVCNGGEYKSDHFPQADEGGPIVDPCSDEPQEHFDFLYNKRTKLASVYGKTKRGTITEQLLGLNRPELRSHRSNFVAKLVVLSRFASRSREAEELFLRATRDEAEYAAFARTLAKISKIA